MIDCLAVKLCVWVLMRGRERGKEHSCQGNIWRRGYFPAISRLFYGYFTAVLRLSQPYEDPPVLTPPDSLRAFSCNINYVLYSVRRRILETDLSIRYS